jgi:hypothetical protein
MTLPCRAQITLKQVSRLLQMMKDEVESKIDGGLKMKVVRKVEMEEGG